MKDIGKIRSSFPALKRKATKRLYILMVVASQIPNHFIVHILIMFNDKANAGGYFETSVNTMRQ